MQKQADGDQRFYNLGIGRGYSVKQIIEAVDRVTGKTINVEYGDRRPGDPPQLYANSDLIQRELGWSPKYTDIDDIIATAWNWFKNHPDGYGD
jgi:UDP-glucose 4-epimerase